jgi:hypothetical protein
MNPRHPAGQQRYGFPFLLRQHWQALLNVLLGAFLVPSV